MHAVCTYLIGYKNNTHVANKCWYRATTDLIAIQGILQHTHVDGITGHEFGISGYLDSPEVVPTLSEYLDSPEVVPTLSGYMTVRKYLSRPLHADVRHCRQ